MNTELIDISHLDKADILAALYNASRPLGMGFMHFDPTPMMKEEASEILKKTHCFDYLKGRVMKVDLSEATLDPWGYDRDNGVGAAAKAIQALQLGGTNAPSIERAHKDGTRKSAEHVRSELDKASELRVDGGVTTMTLGLADVADKLGPKINKAIGHVNQ